ncbi:tRNA (adenosine(37)-N6)-threonylcarbamoyltransferase complex dimerization subunit type 1 TsaB [Nostoc sp. FACHB-152]|uniref:tRNA (adenosine(37)-N6)-threonylcarbamoyltransferase complex dimerization subunit type 1 TsaB n=1 Tax=unclassified Nostoc TaxID=2593658 RepID=UPI0016825BDB|nr:MULTISPECIES: tRNA (adenosine(37)-N6)-threonylcarbamoyltransferase complex dimerization subunit type 1 TsaB [unclassified Nostoc]MBD2447362.1 tRNA (adenosine(37)-N6)-threonylcarbamoyltransferase complex dimerization subunit type 1 TsaB [Nostoc sp. FACHB-152]MBD2468036.1 tRNA (adenosine(37)-N6)-threonylcarbamoyltransferase complex dimerization subunit type 1 TsaB [Nostoc sp. FACHB-145]
MATELTTLSAQKYALSLHTTTPELGLAMSNFAGETRTNVWNLGRDLSSYVHQYLIDFIQPQTWADLAFIAVAKGPGGFTGTRIGVVTARTLGQQLNIPVFAISTLAAVAWSNKNDYKKAIAIEMPAQRGKVFGAIYQINSITSELTTLFPDTVLTPEAWQETLTNCNIEYQLIQAQSGLAATVTSILELSYLDWRQGKRTEWSEALPYYGQHPVEI